MAAPVSDKIILPADGGNLGKNIRTQRRTVGADVVHEYMMVPVSRRELMGVYYAPSTAAQAVQATAQTGTGTGFFWLEMPTVAAKRARLRRFSIRFGYGAAPTADHLTLPRIALTRFTFTGTASGASIVPAKRHGNDAANSASLRTAATGMTITLAGIGWIGFPPGIDFATAVGQNTLPGEMQEFIPLSEDDFWDWGPGEGVLLYQPDAGTTGDVRRFHWNLEWDEYDNS